jgi:hypothetical protein
MIKMQKTFGNNSLSAGITCSQGYTALSGCRTFLPTNTTIFVVVRSRRLGGKSSVRIFFAPEENDRHRLFPRRGLLVPDSCTSFRSIVPEMKEKPQLSLIIVTDKIIIVNHHRRRRRRVVERRDKAVWHFLRRSIAKHVAAAMNSDE